ncbi:hypothetical protein OAQ01_01310 [Emcibacteraceae bacterium]|nr:hypothetical protein [Emcibacteraceae bacterium]
MSKKINKAGLAMAVAAASMFTAATSTLSTVAQEANVQCMGVNACKDQGACKGQGFLMMSAEDCTAKGGKAAPMKM